MCGVCKPTQEIRGTVTRSLDQTALQLDYNNKGTAPQYRNISDLSDTETHYTVVAVVGAADLPAVHSCELANKKRFEKRLYCCFPMAANSTDGESGVLRSRQYHYYIQSD